MAETAVKKKISMIPAKAQYDRDVKLTEKKLRVAAYCRVSTELEQQERNTAESHGRETEERRLSGDAQTG